MTRDQIIYLTGAVRLARLVLEERRRNMARDYMNLPAMLDALEDEMDQEAAQISDEARKIQARGLQEMERTRTAIKNKSGLIDRMKKFADDMETRNTSNAPPGMGLTTISHDKVVD